MNLEKIGLQFLFIEFVSFFIYRSKSKWEESVRDKSEENREWRWSESPEVELEHRLKGSEKERSLSIENSHRSSRDRRYERNERSSVRSSSKRSQSSTSSKRHRRSSRKERHSEIQGEEASRSTKRHKKKSRRRSDSENDHEEPKRKHQRISEVVDLKEINV